MNALDPPMLFGLAEAWDKAEEDDDVWVVMVTGAGDEAFCVGADLKTTVPKTAASARGENDGQQERWPSMARTLLRDRFFPKPIVAAVNGHCIAGGFGLLLATDLRYASTSATFGMQEVRWGLFPIAGSAVKGLGMPMAQAFQQELRLAQDVYASADAVEGPAAFADKREPRFQGK